MKQNKAILAVLSVLLLFGCMLPKEVRKKNRARAKIARLAKQYNLQDTTTVTFRDTIYLEGVKVDSLFVFQSDTIRYYQDRMQVEVIRVPDTDSIYIYAECPPDTIYRTNTVTITTPVVQSWKVDLWNIYKRFRLWFWIIIIAIGIGLLVKFAKKIPFIKNFIP